MYEIIKEQTKVDINYIDLKDEFNRDEICNNIKTNQRLIIKADIAGAGKTSAFTYFSEQTEEETLFVTPYNALFL